MLPQKRLTPERGRVRKRFLHFFLPIRRLVCFNALTPVLPNARRGAALRLNSSVCAMKRKKPQDGTRGSGDAAGLEAKVEIRTREEADAPGTDDDGQAANPDEDKPCGTPKPPKVRVVNAWEGGVDPMVMNRAILAIIRQNEDPEKVTDTELAARSGMTRQHAHNMRSEDMVLTVPIMMKYCNGKHVELAYLIDAAASCVRQTQRKGKSGRDGPACPGKGGRKR